MKKFEINDCGVCLNADILWIYPNPEPVGWNYAKLKIGSDNAGNWAFGYSHYGGGGPCSPRYDKFKSREEAEEAAIAFFKKWTEEPDDHGIGNPKEVREAKEAFLKWSANLNQLTLF